MRRLLFLTKGELIRLNKYKVTTISILVAFIWFLVLFFIEDDAILNQMLPFILMVDATMMSVLFVGSIMFFEKSEQTISTILVTPTTYHEQILSKAIANTIHMLFSSLLVVLVFYFARGIEVNIFWLLLGLVISIFSHSLLGFFFSYHAKDFTSMLMMVMMYSFIFTIPSALFQFKIFFVEDFWKYVLLISPTQAANYMIESGFIENIKLEGILAFVIFITLTILGYFFYIYPKYKHYAVKQSGV